MSWPKLKIGDITHVVTKGTTPTKDHGFVENGVNFIKAEALNGDSALDPKGIFHISEDVHQKLKRSILQVDDVLLTIAGAKIGKCGLVTPFNLPANTNQAVGIMRVDRSKADPRYLYYWFKQRRTFAFVQGLNAQAAQPNINLSMLKNIEIPLPLMVEQRTIIAILSAYDDLIENNRRRILLLEQAARLLYREWFVHLRFPGHEHVKIKDGVPDGWEKKPLFDIASPTYGFAFKSKLFNTDGEGVPVARIRNIPSGESQTYTTEEAPEEKLLEDGEFVIGMDGDFHMNFWTGGKTWINQRVVRLKGVGDFNDAFLRYACEKPIQDFNATIAGTTVAHLGAKHLKLIGLLIPPKGILYEAQDFFGSTQAQIVALSNQSRLAKNARDLLLPRLMNGEVPI